MKYKVGDKVKIKTWEEIKKSRSTASWATSFIKYMEEFEKCYSNRIVEIAEIYKQFYKIKGNNYWTWKDDMIECLVEKYKEPGQITSRFDILDIR